MHSFTVVADIAPMLEGADAAQVYVRRTFAFWQAARVHGTIMWGRPEDADVEAMVSVWDRHLRSPFGRDPAVADIRALESVDLLAFERLLRAFADHRHEWPSRTGPQAILHSGGLASAAILGALQIAGQGYDLGVFSDEAEALAWAGGHAFASDYAELRAELLGQPQVVRRVRSVLDEAERPPATDELARRVGLSVRSLQRHLASEGTSLRELRARHAVEQIERLLTGTDLDLSAIAARLGLASAGRIVSLFRAARGMTPGAFRASREPASRASQEEQERAQD